MSDDRADTDELEAGEVTVAALAHEVVGLRRDLGDYRTVLEARLRHRSRTSLALAALSALLVLALAAGGVLLARAEARVSQQTLEASVAQTCLELAELELILVTFLEDARAAAAERGDDSGPRLEGLIGSLSSSPCPSSPIPEPGASPP